jgi:small subunit ribosomal protein S20
MKKTLKVIAIIVGIAAVAIETNATDKNELVKVAVKKIDQAAAKGLLHKNNAARKKSALVTKLNKA